MTYRRLHLTAVLLFLPFFSGISAQEISGELMLRAIRHSYPEKTGDVVFQNGDWTIQAGAETFYWAGGRLLPAGERDKLISYSPHPFEIYPAAVPSPEIYSAQYAETLRLRGSDEARKNREDHHRGFQAVLYGGLNRREIEARLTGIVFLGKKINVHRDIAEALTRVDAAVQKAAREDSARGNTELAGFIASIAQIGGYNWRDIRGTRRMSYHSWGLAVDVQPKNLSGKSIYWLWERARNHNWMLIPLESRWQPPLQIIEAFEREGFIWGGKWALYDNMHFEYRPELHELNRLLAAHTESPGYGDTPASGQDLHHLYPDQLITR